MRNASCKRHCGLAPLLAALSGLALVGCQTVHNNNIEIDTALGKVTTGGNVIAPLGSQPVAGQWTADIPVGSPQNPNNIPPFGTSYSFEGVTDPFYTYIPGFGWPTHLLTYNDRMPATWDFQWEHPPYCHDAQDPPYPLLPNPFIVINSVQIPTFSYSRNPGETFTCFENSPANPDFNPFEVSPQFVLDDALPTSIQVSAFSPINAAASITNLRLFSMNLTNPTNLTAISVASDGSSAVFPYPTNSDGSALPAGPYITTITTDPPGGSQTTNGMEPIYIAHDDTSYTSAFAVAAATPSDVWENFGAQDIYNDGTCAGQPYDYKYQYGGNQTPLVTLSTLGQLAVGPASQTISVGTNPTVVIPYNDQEIDNYWQRDQCDQEQETITGAQSALVVNTGSNSISLVNIGYYSYPGGTVQVGSQPVAAVINPAETFAYVANYADGTISEVNLQTVQLTRTLSVGNNPSSVSFDYNGNLWVGGQGYLELINVATWSVWTSYPLDGTVAGMSYDTRMGAFICTLLQNGTRTSRSNGRTLRNPVVFSRAGGTSYSTTAIVNVATGSTTLFSTAVDTAPYVLSRFAPSLATPTQNALNPLIYSATNGDLAATVNGNAFAVTSIPSGNVLISGTLPYPARGVALTPTMLYFTMPESNSLVSLPLQLP